MTESNKTENFSQEEIMAEMAKQKQGAKEQGFNKVVHDIRENQLKNSVNESSVQEIAVDQEHSLENTQKVVKSDADSLEFESLEAEKNGYNLQIIDFQPGAEDFEVNFERKKFTRSFKEMDEFYLDDFERLGFEEGEDFRKTEDNHLEIEDSRMFSMIVNFDNLGSVTTESEKVKKLKEDAMKFANLGLVIVGKKKISENEVGFTLKKIKEDQDPKSFFELKKKVKQKKGEEEVEENIVLSLQQFNKAYMAPVWNQKMNKKDDVDFTDLIAIGDMGGLEVRMMEGGMAEVLDSLGEKGEYIFRNEPLINMPSDRFLKELEIYLELSSQKSLDKLSGFRGGKFTIDYVDYKDFQNKKKEFHFGMNQKENQELAKELKEFIDEYNVETIFGKREEVWERADGKEFEQILKEKKSEKKEGKTSVLDKELIDFSEEFIQALAQMRSQNIVHRDLKPANIIMDKEGHIKIIDFGIGIRDGEKGAKGIILGTPRYMSPGQFRNQSENNPASCDDDMYTLAPILYEMATGKGLHDEFVKEKMNLRIFHEYRTAGREGEFQRTNPKLNSKDYVNELFGSHGNIKINDFAENELKNIEMNPVLKRMIINILNDAENSPVKLNNIEDLEKVFDLVKLYEQGKEIFESREEKESSVPLDFGIEPFGENKKESNFVGLFEKVNFENNEDKLNIGQEILQINRDLRKKPDEFSDVDLEDLLNQLKEKEEVVENTKALKKAFESLGKSINTELGKRKDMVDKVEELKEKRIEELKKESKRFKVLDFIDQLSLGPSDVSFSIGSPEEINWEDKNDIMTLIQSMNLKAQQLRKGSVKYGELRVLKDELDALEGPISQVDFPKVKRSYQTLKKRLYDYVDRKEDEIYDGMIQTVIGK